MSSNPNEYHLTLSPFLRKRIEQAARDNYENGMSENAYISAWLRRAAIEKIERDSRRFEEVERQKG